LRRGKREGRGGGGAGGREKGEGRRRKSVRGGEGENALYLELGKLVV
jgi:hypothetical protein